MVRKPDGTRVIRTPENQHRRPTQLVTDEKLKILKILSIVAIVIFVPTGAVAFYYYKKTLKEYAIGKQKNDLRKAKRLSTKCERFILFSVLCAVIAYTLIVVIVEETSWKHHTFSGSLG